jgi:APA family basic amino acid/polyamine antiporter
MSAWNRAGDGLAVVALFSTANTMLLMLVAASRLVYGMASAEALPRFLAWVHPRQHTPVRAIVLGLVVAVGFALSGDLGLVAGASNFAAFVGFGAVHGALIVLRFRRPDLHRPFRVPGAVRGVSLLSVAGLAIVALLMASLSREALIIGGTLFVLGIAGAALLRLWHPADPPAAEARSSGRG